jgi:hypothetical protein
VLMTHPDWTHRLNQTQPSTQTVLPRIRNLPSTVIALAHGVMDEQALARLPSLHMHVTSELSSSGSGRMWLDNFERVGRIGAAPQPPLYVTQYQQASRRG